MDQQSIAAERCKRTWMKADSGDFEAFKAQVAQTAREEDWPNASAVERNVLIYDGDNVRDMARCPSAASN